jgi:hypothetical protein
MIEEWKDIKGYDGVYQISNMGRVKSFHKKQPKMLKPIYFGDYLGVQLCGNGVKNKHYIHRLVVESFLTNTHEKNQVNHKDGNKINNVLSNLEWCTASENRRHAVDNGLLMVLGEDNPQSKLTETDVVDIINTYNVGVFSQHEIARAFGIGVMQINRIVNGKAWTHI